MVIKGFHVEYIHKRSRSFRPMASSPEAGLPNLKTRSPGTNFVRANRYFDRAKRPLFVHKRKQINNLRTLITIRCQQCRWFLARQLNYCHVFTLSEFKTCGILHTLYSRSDFMPSRPHLLKRITLIIMPENPYSSLIMLDVISPVVALGTLSWLKEELGLNTIFCL